MDALRTLIEGVLPPAGNPIRIAVSPHISTVQSLFPERALNWTDSGTSALALALLDIRRTAPTVERPEVIIPAYCCPDLVSAALYAGYTPVFSDFGSNQCHYDRDALQNALSDNTLAIIAINFLGVAESLETIRATLNSSKVAIIEDNAQWFPGKPAPLGSTADYQTFSFGRGKPVNLLSGGLMVSASKSNQAPGAEAALRLKCWLYYGKCAAYNALLSPRRYQALARNPIVKLGETRYHPLTKIGPLPTGPNRLLGANIHSYWSHENRAEKRYRQYLSTVNALSPLIEASEERLLRYPLLVDSVQTRNELLNQLSKRGLGATKLYGDTIDRIDHVPTDLLRQAGDKTNAFSFAQRLLTLPIHEGVKQKHVDQTLEIIEKTVGHSSWLT